MSEEESNNALRSCASNKKRAFSGTASVSRSKKETRWEKVGETMNGLVANHSEEPVAVRGDRNGCQPLSSVFAASFK